MLFFWLILYGSVLLLSHRFSALSPWITPLGLLITAAALVLWVIRRQRTLLSFRQLAAISRKQWLQIVPLFFPVVGNVLCFGVPAHSGPAVLSCFLAAVQEELLFRGILLPCLSRKRTGTGVILSSLAFAAAHFLNMERGADLLYTLYQAAFALSAGLALSGLVLSCKSLLPGIGTHFVINTTASNDYRLSAASAVLLWLSILLYSVCGMVLLRKSNHKKKGCFHETIH